MQYKPNTNIICLSMSEVVNNNLLSAENFYKLAQRERIAVSGPKGNKIVEFYSLPEEAQQKWIEKFGNPMELINQEPIKRLLVPDMEAANFYAKHKLPNGGTLGAEDQLKYKRQAEWLNLIILLLSDKPAMKSQFNLSSANEMWELIIKLHQADTPIDPKLPTNKVKLQAKLKLYKDNGYAALISGKFGNQNTRKVTEKIENLLVSLCCQPHKPYFTQVCHDYREFMEGKRTIVDKESGEIFNPQDFYVDGAPYEVSVETVKHYMNKPANALALKKHNTSDFEYRLTTRPHHHRKAPMYAFSKITMDDTSSPFKMHNNKRPATYKIFDVASGALVAMAMVKDDATADLVRWVLRNFMRLIVDRGWKMPHTVEVEHALNSALKGKKDKDTGEQITTDVLSQGAVFPNVRFCAPRNPQEKRAEGFIKAIKYGYQKHREGFQYRPFAKRDANRMNEDADNARYTFAEIEAMEREDMDLYNNAPHPDQDKYPGKTRWQVLEEYQNPSLMEPNLPLIMPYIGQKVLTSVRRGFVEAKYNKYTLEDINILERLNGTQVAAYYLPKDNGAIPEIYLYQDGEYIGKGIEIERYQEALAERTEQDEDTRKKQQQYIKDFDVLVDKKTALLSSLATAPATQATLPPAGDYEAAKVLATEQETGDETPEISAENSTTEGGYTTETAKKTNWWEDEDERKRRAIEGL